MAPEPAELVPAVAARFRDDPDVEVIVERRRADRRGLADRRGPQPAAFDEVERRTPSPAGERRVRERRSKTVSVRRSLPLGSLAPEHALQVSFVRRFQGPGSPADLARRERPVEFEHLETRLERARTATAHWRERCLRAERDGLELLRALVGAADDMRAMRRLTPRWLLAVYRADRAVERAREAREAQPHTP